MQERRCNTLTIDLRLTVASSATTLCCSVHAEKTTARFRSRIVKCAVSSKRTA